MGQTPDIGEYYAQQKLALGDAKNEFITDIVRWNIGEFVNMYLEDIVEEINQQTEAFDVEEEHVYNHIKNQDIESIELTAEWLELDGKYKLKVRE
ncbi:MAG: hypothetical protein ABEJ98_03540 [Candidatus Nanohaloarchaea archaeon]